jgi:spoIIIJ-associated protein
MPTKMEYTGKDVPEAIKNACSQLNVSQDQLKIEIQSLGSVGIFGLCRKQAKILVSLRSEAPPVPPVAGDQIAPAGPAKAKAGTSPPPTEDSQGQAASDRDYTALMADIDGNLSQLLSLMGFPSQVTVHRENNKFVARITGEYADEIIGPDGQTLDNLQYLLRKMINKKHAEKATISLDAGNYREARGKDLEELARRLAQEVKDSGKTRSIPALNPAERRIVHMVLQDDSTIRSRSVGEGLFKKILIYLPGRGRKKSPRNGKNKSES